MKLFPSLLTRLLSILLLVTALEACSDSADKILDVPESYDATNFDKNAAVELQVLSRLSALVTEMQRGRNSANSVTYEALNTLYTAGSPSVADITTDYYNSRITGTNGWLAQLATSSGKTYTPATPNGNGGVLGAYLFNQYGLELEQVVEKGLFSAALYNHFVNLSNQEITTATVDRMLAIFGANPTFPNSNNATLHTRPDRVSAVYAARRDKNDNAGFYTVIRNNFIKLQAAIKAGSDFNDERNDALAEIKQNWEKALMATVINYCYSTTSTLIGSNLTDAKLGSALHAYSEGVGFLHGWRTLSQADRIITDAQIDALLIKMNVPQSGNPSSYLFVTDAVNQLPKLLELIQDLKGIYGFSDAQLEDFKKNWVNEQAR